MWEEKKLLYDKNGKEVGYEVETGYYWYEYLSGMFWAMKEGYKSYGLYVLLLPIIVLHILIRDSITNRKKKKDDDARPCEPG